MRDTKKSETKIRFHFNCSPPPVTFEIREAD